MQFLLNLDMVLTMKSDAQAHWRDSARSIKFFIWDGKAAFPMVLFLVYMHVWTLIVAVASMMFFTLLNRYGFSPIVFLRWLRSTLAGHRKMAVPWWME